MYKNFKFKIKDQIFIDQVSDKVLNQVRNDVLLIIRNQLWYRWDISYEI